MIKIKRDCNFILAMNPIATVASLLLLLCSTMLYVSGTPTERKMENISRGSSISLNDSAEIFEQKKNKTEERQISSDESEKTAAIGVVNTTVTLIHKQDSSTAIKIPSAIEAKDMEESFVHPKDDDDDDSIPRVLSPKPENKSETTVTSIDLLNADTLSEMMKEDEKHATLPGKIFPDNPDKSITDLPLDVQRKFTHDTYFIDNGETNTTKVSVANVDIVPLESTTTKSINVPNVEGSFLTLETREEMVKKHSNMPALENKNETEKMPPGVVALISAIGFAIIAVIAYISLIGWKRYQEYLHGHRELLVNDFDSNDINNFEL